MTRMPLSFPAIDAGVLPLSANWWNDINESVKWQDGIFFTLCAAYGLVSLIALIQLIRIELRVPEYGWTTQKVFHHMNFIVNGGLDIGPVGSSWSTVLLHVYASCPFLGRDIPSVVSFIAAIGFLLYGGRLFFMLRRFPIESKREEKETS